MRTDISYDFGQIKAFYDYLTPMIMRYRSGDNVSRWLDPYGLDWSSMFSPIEEQTWMALRCFGKCPLYPQYPVGKYFCDFGNPCVKVAIECDGRQWHTDKEKDKRRDEEFYKLGWSVFRISGSDCFRVVDDAELEYKCEDENMQILTDMFDKTVEGLIESIAIFYFGYRTFNVNIDKDELAFSCLSDRISIGREEFQRKAQVVMLNNRMTIPDEIRWKTNWL